MRRTVHGPPAMSGNKPPPRLEYRPPDEEPEIIHEDKDLLVVCKPAGLLSVPGKQPQHHDCLQSRLHQHHAQATMVHRLDMDTSGLMVLAKNRKAHRHLGLQFERRQITKRYVALVDGNPDSDSGTVNLPLRTDWPNRPKQVVDACLGRSSVTQWRVLERLAGQSRILLTPETGRTHQIRVHLAELGHPIIGDRFYGNSKSATIGKRLMLHAQTLKLHHPGDGQRLEFDCPCPF